MVGRIWSERLITETGNCIWGLMEVEILKRETLFVIDEVEILKRETLFVIDESRNTETVNSI